MKPSNALIAAELRAMIRARRLRDRFFDPELFADPAWDILLDLAAAQLEGRTISVSSACIAAAVPPGTALRHIDTLVGRGLVLRRPHPHDRRSRLLSLPAATLGRIIAYVGATEPLAGPRSPVGRRRRIRQIEEATADLRRASRRLEGLLR